MARSSVEDMESSESLWKTSESDEEDVDDDAEDDTEDDADACATLCSRSGVSVRLAGVRRIRLYSASVICALYQVGVPVTVASYVCIVTLIYP